MKKSILLFAILLTGCEPQDLSLFNVEAIIIDKCNVQHYKYSDLSDPNMGWVEKDNGELITYYFEADRIFITSDKDLKNVYYMDGNDKIQSPSVYDSKYFYQVIDTTQKNVFRLYY